MDLDDDDDTSALTHPAASAVTAIAKIDTMLELLPVSHNLKPMLERMLPVYDPPDVFTSQEQARSHFLSNSLHASRDSIFANLPAPLTQCEEAWLEIMAIESEGRCARAGKATALRVWGLIVDYASLEGLDLSGSVNFKAFFESLRAEPIDAAVAEGVLRCLEDKNFPNDTAHSLRLDRVKTVQWTGLTLLQVSSEKASAKPALQKDDYVAQWQDLLPEAWRGDAALDKLPEDSHTILSMMDQETISWTGLGRAGVHAAQKTAPQADASGKTTAGKRKWHEKFKAQRKEFKK